MTTFVYHLRATVEDEQIIDTLRQIGKQDIPYPVELQEATRGEFVERVQQYNTNSDGLWMSDPDSVEGSDTSMASQLEDAGFGSFGPM